MSVFTADFSTNHSGSIICETSSPLLLLVWVARTKLNSKKSLASLLSLPSFFGCLGKGTKNTAEHVITNKIFIYARACPNKDFVHSGPIGLISVRNVPKFKVRANWSRDTFQPMRRRAWRRTRTESDRIEDELTVLVYVSHVIFQRKHFM